MIKGCEKRVVHVKNPENSLFEEAFFFLKQNQPSALPPAELWREAEKIVNQSLFESYQDEDKHKSNRLVCLLFFAVGLVTGVGGTLLIGLL